MSNIDKTIRLVIAALIFVYFEPRIWALIAILPLLTAVYGCPLYMFIKKKK